ncbi:MAG: hypothetical protein KM310_06255 [Clostridiales bacterium]|nr:hypothetical protein [Clostridiales bacterium]
MKRTSRLVAVITMMALALWPSGSTFAQEPTEIIDQQTVYGLLRSDGSVQKIIVVDWIHVKGQGPVTVRIPGPREKVTNLSGPELPRLQGNDILWTFEVNGAHDFFYSSETSKPLPVDISITYKLDGRPVEAQDLAGKDGRLQIEVHLTAREKKVQTVTYHDETGKLRSIDKELYVPFLAMVSANIPVDRFEDIDTHGATTVVTGKTMSATWMVVPNPEATVTLEMTGKAIELDPLTITLLPGLPPLPPVPLDPSLLEQVAEGIQSLSSALDQLDGGAAGLSTGLGKMELGLRQLHESLQKLQQAAGAQAMLLEQLRSSHEQLMALAKELQEAASENPQLQGRLQPLVEGLYKEQQILMLLTEGGTWQGQPFPSFKDLQGGLQAAGDGAGQMAGALHQSAAGASRLSGGLQELARGTSGMSTQLQSGLAQIRQGQAVMEATQRLAEGYDSFIGKPSGAKGDVRFILKTEEIRAPQPESPQGSPAATAPEASQKPTSLWEMIRSFFLRLFQR